MTPVSGLEYALAVVVLVVAVLVTAMSAAVVLYYARVLRVARAGRYGLLLWHIVTIAGSVTGTWLLIALAQLDNARIWDTPLQVRLLGYAFFGLTTVTAIGIIAVTQRRRVQYVATRRGRQPVIRTDGDVEAEVITDREQRGG